MPSIDLRQFETIVRVLNKSKQTELSRLDRQHLMWKTVLDGQLIKAPIAKPKRVLDLGTGTGVWAVDFGK